jgi:proteasome lid subunit RPN8/RPN11
VGKFFTRRNEKQFYRKERKGREDSVVFSLRSSRSLRFDCMRGLLKITCGKLKQLVLQARRDAPNETCGIIGGKEGRALKIFPLKNVDRAARTNYYAEPLELLRALREIEDNDWEHLAVYHSHPASPAYPSPTDIARAFYPDAIHLILSLMNPEQTSVRAFRIVQGQVNEVTLEIEDDDESQRENSRRAARRTHRPRARRAVASLSGRRPARRNARRARRRIPRKV